jgi:L-threonylcarbamoyladenylate synthase
MQLLSIPTVGEIEKAAKALKDGHLVAFPTETVYGLGADATNEKAVSRVYSVKGRPTDHPLIVHISSIKQLDKWAIDIPEYAIKLAEEFWPGPITLILKRSQLAKDFITGGQDNVGLRVPTHPVALEVLKQFEKLGGKGIAAPSANKFGAVSPTSAQSVIEELESGFIDEDLILDGGQCEIGIESTIVDCTNYLPKVLRPGAITKEMIESISGRILTFTEPEANTRAPGMLSAHYSPRALVELNAKAEKGDGFIALSNIPTPEGAIRLGSPKSTEQYAYQLYELLRLGDSIGLGKIHVVLPLTGKLSVAIFDRMTKAAVGRK